MKRCLIAAVLAAAAMLLLGVILGRSEEPPVVWREGDDGILPADPYLASWTAS